MNCFNHADRSATGSCKYCGKGLCPECVSDLGHGLACKNAHEQEVENLHMIISKNIKIYSSASTHTLIVPIFYLFLGVVFAGFGYFSKRGITDFSFIMGVGLIVFAIVVFTRNRKIFGKNA